MQNRQLDSLKDSLEKTIIAWDLGGTNCRAAIVQGRRGAEHFACVQQTSIKLTDCNSLSELALRVEQELGMRMRDADAMCIGAAGQYDGEKLCLEAGYPYEMDIAAVAQQQQWPQFNVVHDYTPVLCATFTSYLQDPANIKFINQGKFNPYGRRVAMGVGTGLGVKDGILLPHGGFWLGTNEMGHIGVTHPPQTKTNYVRRHDRLLSFLRKKGVLQPNEPLTFEKILSGQGMVRLHHFVQGVKQECTPEEVGILCRNGEAEETNAIFAWYLGLFVGAVQLALMPDGGIWITGGVVLKHFDIFDHPEFHLGVQASPAYQKLRADFPLGIMRNTEHAFVGGAFYALQKIT